MIIRPPSLVREYDEFCALDSAFFRPEELEGYEQKLETCRETCNWTPLVKNGVQPTKFVMKQVDRSIYREIRDRMTLSEDSPRRISVYVVHALLFRLAITNIVGGPEGADGVIKHAPDPRWDGWVMAPVELTNALDEIDPRIVNDLGGAVLDRVRGSPK